MDWKAAPATWAAISMLGIVVACFLAYRSVAKERDRAIADLRDQSLALDDQANRAKMILEGLHAAGTKLLSTHYRDMGGPAITWVRAHDSWRNDVLAALREHWGAHAEAKFARAVQTVIHESGHSDLNDYGPSRVGLGKLLRKLESLISDTKERE